MSVRMFQLPISGLAPEPPDHDDTRATPAVLAAAGSLSEGLLILNLLLIRLWSSLLPLIALTQRSGFNSNSKMARLLHATRRDDMIGGDSCARGVNGSSCRHRDYAGLLLIQPALELPNRTPNTLLLAGLRWIDEAFVEQARRTIPLVVLDHVSVVTKDAHARIDHIGIKGQAAVLCNLRQCHFDA